MTESKEQQKNPTNTQGESAPDVSEEHLNLQKNLEAQSEVQSEAQEAVKSIDPFEQKVSESNITFENESVRADAKKRFLRALSKLVSDGRTIRADIYAAYIQYATEAYFQALQKQNDNNTFFKKIESHEVDKISPPISFYDWCKLPENRNRYLTADETFDPEIFEDNKKAAEAAKVTASETQKQTTQALPETPETASAQPKTTTDTVSGTPPNTPKDGLKEKFDKAWTNIKGVLQLSAVVTGLVYVAKWLKAQGWFGDWMGGTLASIAGSFSDTLSEEQVAQLEDIGIRRVTNEKGEAAFEYASADTMLARLNIDESDREEIGKLTLAAISRKSNESDREEVEDLTLAAISGKPSEEATAQLPAKLQEYNQQLSNFANMVSALDLSGVDPEKTTISDLLARSSVQKKFYDDINSLTATA